MFIGTYEPVVFPFLVTLSSINIALFKRFIFSLGKTNTLLRSFRNQVTITHFFHLIFWFEQSLFNGIRRFMTSFICFCARNQNQMKIEQLIIPLYEPKKKKLQRLQKYSYNWIPRKCICIHQKTRKFSANFPSIDRTLLNLVVLLQAIG